jgi:hypothetical protein
MRVNKITKKRSGSPERLWEHTGSNRGPSACKADALNQLSYAPFYFEDCKYKRYNFPEKFFSFFPDRFNILNY